MSKKRSGEEVVVAYFQETSLTEAKVVFNVVRGIMSRRILAPTSEPPTKATVAAKAKRKRRTKAELAAARTPVPTDTLNGQQAAAE